MDDAAKSRGTAASATARELTALKLCLCAGPLIPSGMNERIERIIEDFDLLDNWDDRYRYVIELGRKLPEMPAADHVDANKVQGCASQVWLTSTRDGDRLAFHGDSDAHIVKGLIAILFALYSGETAKNILATDANALFNKLGLGEHLTPQRSNGFRSMVDRMKRDAQAAING